MKIFLFLLFSGIIFNSCKTTDAPERYLQKLLARLDGVKSAACYETALSWQPGDTIPTVTNFRFFRKLLYPKFVKL